MVLSTKRNGLTIIEIIISTTLIVILVGFGFLILNPAGQIAGARNTERSLHLQSLMNAIRQNIADHSGQTFSCAAGPLPSSTKKIAVGAVNYDIASCLIPTYLTVLPFDPTATGAHYSSNSDYDTGYNIFQNSTTLQITLTAPSAELGKSVSLIR